MIWDLWNLTCLGDPRAWPYARREAHGGKPDWARSAALAYPMHVGYFGWMFGLRPVGLREWPEWLRRPTEMGNGR